MKILLSLTLSLSAVHAAQEEKGPNPADHCDSSDTPFRGSITIYKQPRPHPSGREHRPLEALYLSESISGDCECTVHWEATEPPLMCLKFKNANSEYEFPCGSYNHSRGSRNTILWYDRSAQTLYAGEVSVKYTMNGTWENKPALHGKIRTGQLYCIRTQHPDPNNPDAPLKPYHFFSVEDAVANVVKSMTGVKKTIQKLWGWVNPLSSGLAETDTDAHEDCADDSTDFKDHIAECVNQKWHSTMEIVDGLGIKTGKQVDLTTADILECDMLRSHIALFKVQIHGEPNQAHQIGEQIVNSWKESKLPEWIRNRYDGFGQTIQHQAHRLELTQ